MTSRIRSRYIFEHMQIPSRWVLFLLAVAILAFMAFSASLYDQGSPTAAQDGMAGATSQHQVVTATEMNGSIDPFAPYYGEGDMIGQSIVFFNQERIGREVYRACTLGIPCW